MNTSRSRIIAPLTASALIAQQVGANAMRDGLFLSLFRVESLPYFMACAAAVAVPAAQFSGYALSRFGPRRIVPLVLGVSATMFVIEYGLLGWLPAAAATLLYFHSSVIGAVAISAYWSLLNESFDPHSAKRIMARVAAGATVGGVIGGVGAERVASLLSQSTLLLLLALIGAGCVAGALLVSSAEPPRRTRPETEPERLSGWTQIRRLSLLRHLALVVVLAAVLAALVDYVLKAEAVAHFGRGPALIRFFGFFYAGSGLLAALIQTSIGRRVLERLGLGGAVASHPVVVGAAALVGIALPFPFRGLMPRTLDIGVRNSVFTAGYELLYTPLAEETKRSAKSLIDVACDCVGKGLGAGVILVLVGIEPRYAFLTVSLAAVTIAAAEFVVARRLRTDYVNALEGGMRRHNTDVDLTPQYSVADFTVVGSMAGLNVAALRRKAAEGHPVHSPPAVSSSDPVIAALIDLRSGDRVRIRSALRAAPTDPLLVPALVPLLTHDDLVRPVVAALASFGARAAGEVVSAFVDPGTPATVQRRLPLALKSCASPIARDGLFYGLGSDHFEIRLRSGRAALALTDEHPELRAPFPGVMAAVERELASGNEPHLVREHVFNLLALALDREPMRIAVRALTSDDVYVRGTAIEYLETVLPAPIFSALYPFLSVVAPAAAARRSVADLRAELMRAGSSMTVSLDDIRRQLAATAEDER